ncbi:MAG: glycosyltransferase [Deltaproteobacteria bacterium]|nr:glycosyltransferase [Deltaproteobacteria bacterium]
MMIVSIVIPVHNEADNIRPLIDEINMLPWNYPYQVVVVDDASRDNTPSVLKREPIIS